jgi:hypothetical protein
LPGAICVWPAGSWIPTWRRRAGDGPLQQTFEKTLKAWLQHIGIKPPHSHDIARLLVLLEQDGVDVRELLALRAFTTFAVQGLSADNEVGRSATSSLAGWVSAGHPGADAQGPGDAGTTDQPPTQALHGQTTRRQQPGGCGGSGGHLGAQCPPD